MELNYIRDFVEIAATSSFFNAAENRYTSQSSMSKHIKALEEEVGVSLLDRTTRRVVLSEYGKVFLPYAKAIVKAQDGYLTAIDEMLHTTCVSVGLIPTISQYNIMDMLYQFQKDNSDSKVNMIDGDSVELEAQLLGGTLDLAFMREIGDGSPMLDRIILFKDTLKAIVPNNSALAERKSIELASLANENFASLPKGTMLRDLCHGKCAEAGFEMRVSFEGSNLDNLIDFVSKGMGVALLTQGQTRLIRSRRVEAVDLSPETACYVSLCWKKGVKLPCNAKRIIDFVKNWLDGTGKSDAVLT